MSANLIELLGEKLQKGSETVATGEALQGKEVIGLYFSAHWCGPCRMFTPQLTEAYKKLTGAGKSFEVVFVSSDRDDAGFSDYYGTMPWLALPFSERKLKAKLSSKYKVRGIPSLILLDAEGNIITKDGRSCAADVDKFPWKPPSLSEVMGNAEILTKDGGKTSLKQIQADGTTHLGLYFSAHWCPPCKQFTPVLGKTYTTVKEAGKKFECLFVSSDRDQESFDEYWGSMPFCALTFADRDTKETLSAHFEVEGIPTLVILDAQTLEVVNDNARGLVSADPQGQDFPWAPPLVLEIDEHGPGGLNELPSLVALAEKAEGEWDALEGAMAEVAGELRAKGEDWCFGICKEVGGIGSQIRKLCKSPAASASADVVLLDLADEGAFYNVPKGAATSAPALNQLISDFKAGALERLTVG